MTIALIAVVAAATAGNNTWTTTGPEGGSVNSIAIDPSNPQTVFISTGSGGAYKSTNGASNWKAMNAGLGSVDVNALACDGAAPSTLYAGVSGRGTYSITFTAADNLRH